MALRKSASAENAEHTWLRVAWSHVAIGRYHKGQDGNVHHAKQRCRDAQPVPEIARFGVGGIVSHGDKDADKQAQQHEQHSGTTAKGTEQADPEVMEYDPPGHGLIAKSQSVD